MVHAIRRLCKLMVFMGALAAAGNVQRWWERKQFIDPASVDVMGLQGRLAEQVKQLQAQKEQLNKNLAALPPESRAIIQDAIADGQTQLLVNPLIARFSRFESKASDAEDDSARGAAADKARRLQALWNKARSVLILLLWIAAGVVAGLGLLGAFMEERFLKAAVGFGMPAARYWLLGLSVFCAVAFSVTQTNPWFDMPVAFYLAPVLMLGSSVFLSLGGAGAEALVLDALSAASAPLASFVMVAAIGYAAKAFS